MNPELVLIRGLPGSGKSTMAGVLARVGYEHFEADMYFVRDGVYRFDSDLLREAHDWCFDRAEEALERGARVVVSNTFTQLWEMERYIAAAHLHEAGPTILTASGPWASVHQVPAEAVQRMRLRWEEIEEYVPCDRHGAAISVPEGSIG